MNGTVLRVSIDIGCALGAVAIAGWVGIRLLRALWSACLELLS